MNETIKVVLENGETKSNLELTGMEPKDIKSILNRVFKSFIDSIEVEVEETLQINSKTDLLEEMKKAYAEVGAKARIENDEPGAPVIENITADDWVKPTEQQLDKYNKEFPKLQDPIARNLYNKLTELQINQLAYFVTDSGILKLQARYSCSCGNFQKKMIPYPTPKKFARCNECGKVNLLVNVKGDFPAVDEFGNFYVTSNMLKRNVPTDW
jgi:hypothetical protein